MVDATAGLVAGLPVAVPSQDGTSSAGAAGPKAAVGLGAVAALDDLGLVVVGTDEGRVVAYRAQVGTVCTHARTRAHKITDTGPRQAQLSPARF